MYINLQRVTADGSIDDSTEAGKEECKSIAPIRSLFKQAQNWPRHRVQATAPRNTVSIPSPKVGLEYNRTRSEKQVDADRVSKNANNSGNAAPVSDRLTSSHVRIVLTSIQPASIMQPGSTNKSAISQPALSRPALSLPGPSQPALMNPPVSSAKARGRKVSNTPIPTNEERIAQFWNGRLDKFGNVSICPFFKIRTLRGRQVY